PDACGSHMDITPTLVELCAPAGFRYHSLGRDVLAPCDNPVAFGADFAVGPDFVADLEGEPRWEAFPDSPSPRIPPDTSALRRRYRDLKGISWWRAVRGAEMPPEGGAKRQP
ncbi:MAG: hypothetical protein N3A38_15555, partial [Planctomycetota bacterium]|nr:hypothetical protein [Planctomycetota bacterium]